MLRSYVAYRDHITNRALLTIDLQIIKQTTTDASLSSSRFPIARPKRKRKSKPVLFAFVHLSRNESLRVMTRISRRRDIKTINKIVFPYSGRERAERYEARMPNGRLKLTKYSVRITRYWNHAKRRTVKGLAQKGWPAILI